MIMKHDNMPSVIGKPPKKHRRNDLDDLANLVVQSDLDLHILRLLTLHPELKVRFRNHDLDALDETTKELLLSDMNYVLGIRTSSKRKP